LLWYERNRPGLGEALSKHAEQQIVGKRGHGKVDENVDGRAGFPTSRCAAASR
jgi:hypothetical protein